MSGHGFISMYTDGLEGYLAFRTSMGCYGASRIWYPKQFDRHCANYSLVNLDPATVEGWEAEQQSSPPHSRSWKFSMRDFGRWARINGNQNALVLSDQWKAGFVRSQPYLLVNTEIRLFFQAASRVESSSAWAASLDVLRRRPESSYAACPGETKVTT